MSSYICLTVFMSPVYVSLRERETVVGRGQTVPFAGKTCLTDRKLPQTLMHKGLFNIISLPATGSAAL